MIVPPCPLKSIGVPFAVSALDAPPKERLAFPAALPVKQSSNMVVPSGSVTPVPFDQLSVITPGVEVLKSDACKPGRLIPVTELKSSSAAL